MRLAVLGSVLCLGVTLLAFSGAEASTAAPHNYRCENCGGGAGPFNAVLPSDLVATVDGQRTRVLNSFALVSVQNRRDDRRVLNHDPGYLFLATLQGGQQAWILNVLQRHPEPQASRSIRRYY